MGRTYLPPIPPRGREKVVWASFFSRRIRVCCAGNGSSHVRTANRHLRGSNRELIVRPSLGTGDGRRTVRRCDQRPFARYSSRENSTGWQAEEGGDDTNRPAPEVPVVLRGRMAALTADDRVVPE